MKKVLFPILALVLALGLAMPMAGTVGASPGIIHVDVNDGGCVVSPQGDPYSVVYCSIQDAIDDATAGDTILVAAGTYNEAVKVDKSLTLKGEPGAIIQPDNTTPKHDGGKRRCGIYVAGVDNVTIEGFEIDGTVGPVHLGIYPLNSDNTIVKNNVIHDITNEIGSPVSDKAGVGILFFGWGQGIDGALIEGNTVYNTGRMGIIVCGMQSVSPYKFVVCSDNIIRNNTVHHAWQGPTNDHGGAVQINGAKNSVIEGNTIHDTGLDQRGIYIAGSVASTPNSIEGNNIYSNHIGIDLEQCHDWVDYGADFPGAAEVHCNYIYDNTAYGLYVYDTDSAYQVNAENNWWGDASGPYHPTTNPSGLGDKVSDNVDYDPWSNAWLNYGDVILSGGFQAGHFPEIWDLTACDLEIRFTYDANGLVDDFGGDAHAWAELGVRQVGYGDFNPTWNVEGAGVWLATDYDWTVNTFDPDPPGSPTQDMDDKLILQKGGGCGEGGYWYWDGTEWALTGGYNLPSIPPNPWANHGVWFDRDGVDQWQAQMWGAIDGGTYTTGGTYDVVITLHATSAFSGTAYMTINGEPQGFYVPGWHSGPADLMPAGMTFTGDMMQMQVFYGLSGYGATHTVVFKDITVKGCLLVLEAGMATGGGWFYAEDTGGIGNVTPGGKATFGFVAKHKDNKSSGQLEFQYKTDDLNLKSTSYDWVTLSNTQVIFEGEGRLNGIDGYKFRVHAFDGDKAGGQPDRFTIRIWTGSDSSTMPTYRAEGDLGGGNIVVHKK